MSEDRQNSVEDLRKRAEALLTKSSEAFRLGDTKSVNDLAHELAVHQVELEMQNEELRNTQLALQQSHDSFAALFEHAPVGYVVLDASGIIRRTNATWRAMLGRPDEDFRGTPFAETLLEEDARLFLSRFRAFFRNPAEKQIVARIKRNGASPSYVQIEARSRDAVPKDVASACPSELMVTISDVTDRKQAEEAVQRNAERLQSIVEILQHDCDGIQEFLDFSLDKAIEITASQIGYIYFYDEERRQFTLNSWSKEVMKECTVANPETCYELDKTGVWGEAVRQREPIILNDFQARHPLKKGYPEGHVHLTRFLTIPVFHQGRIVAVAGVANKKTDYDQTDILELTLLMDAVWKSAENLKSEQKLQESEAYQRRILQTTADGFWVIDGNTRRIVEVNEAYCAMSGYSRDEIMRMEIKDLDAEEKPEETQERIERIIRNGSEVFETTHRRKDGSVLPVEVSVSFLEERGGQFVCFCRDLTKRKQTEERLAVLGRMLDAAPASITIHDTDGRFVFANAATAFLHGYGSVEEFMEVDLHELDVPESEALLAERLRKIAEEGEARFEVGHYRKDGSTFPLEILAKRIAWEGRPAILSIATDITERKRAEKYLMESEVRYKSLHNASFGGIAIHDKGVILECNQGLTEISGFSYNELIGMDGLLLIAERSRDTVMDHIVSGYEEPYDVFGLRKNGEEYPLRLEARNIPYRGTSVRVVEFRDITDRKRAEAEAEKLREQLTQAQKMESVGRLAGGVAHDFNNMLSVILGHTEMLLEDIEGGNPLREDLEEIRKAAERSANLTRQLLTFARKQTVAPKTLDLNVTIASLLKMLERLIGEDIDLAWKPSDRPALVLIDPGQVDQMLANLVVNARDAIGHRNGKVIIETSNAHFDEDRSDDSDAIVPGDYVMLAVSDDGCGMNEETRSHIFEPFFTTKKVGDGTGLGLATVYGIVKQNAGFVNVYSEPGRGSTFRIYLPARRTEPRQHDEPREAHPAPMGGDETILVVEDEVAILNMAKMILQRLGYTVLTANTPSEAVRAVSECCNKIDLIISDVIMPEINGRDLVAKLQDRCPRAKSLFMSGYPAEVIAHQGMLDKNVDFIQKPFSPRDLAKKVREVLERRS